MGATLGYDYGPAFQYAEKYDRIHVSRKPTDAENFLRLSKKQIDTFPCDIEVGYERIRQHFPADERQRFTHHPLTVRADPHHLFLSKKIACNKRMIARFNRGLKQLKASGKVDRYMMESRSGKYRPAVLSKPGQMN